MSDFSRVCVSFSVCFRATLFHALWEATEPWEEVAGAVLIAALPNVSAQNTAARLTRQWILMS